MSQKEVIYNYEDKRIFDIIKLNSKRVHMICSSFMTLVGRMCLDILIYSNLISLSIIIKKKETIIYY